MAKKIETLLATMGRDGAKLNRVVNTPVYHASTVMFDSYADMRDGVKNLDDKPFYGRMGTPTTRDLEDAVCELEGGAVTRLFPSGMAAVTVSLLSVLKAGDHLLMSDSVYEPSKIIAKSLLKRFGVETTYFDPLAGADIAAQFKDNTKAVFLETPGSLTFEVQDIPAISKVAHERGAYVIADCTWGASYFMKGLELGADLSVQAGTKYYVGHSDVMMGCITANERTAAKLKRCRMDLGQTVAPDDAYLTLRGMRTLGIRLEQHQKNALTVANWLEKHPMVDRVLYPPLENCPGHDIFMRDFTGASGLLSFVLKNGAYADLGALADDMELFKMGFSWGGFESLICPSDPTGFRHITPWQANGPLIRLHIGLEHTDDLIEDLDRGFSRYKKVS
ncbi:MAG: cystathionine beta-lyase [Sphingomonadales bacterium]|nr:cystathionine beta-lyase [Sphingomonadales bacterium]